MKKALKFLGAVLAALIIVVLIYVAYVFIDYYRLKDNIELTVEKPVAAGDWQTDDGAQETGDSQTLRQQVPTGKELTVTSWNIGFGAYTDQYSFFMDGGKYSRGFSEEIVSDTVSQMASELEAFGSDFYFIQEIDVDATRSYHINEYEMIAEKFQDKSRVYAQNYDSPYLFYPVLKPHGKSVAGIATISGYDITSALRRSLPIQNGFAKFLDLDRCYSISRIPTDNGKELGLINFHLSAYTTDPAIGDEQLSMLYEDIAKEYEKGNYVVCGGDFNKDLLENSAEIFGVSGEDYSWAKAFPYDKVPDGITVVAPFDEASPAPSCRNADRPWDAETNFQLTVDGFIISDNVKCVKSDVVDLKFTCSDHNPVYMDFILE